MYKLQAILLLLLTTSVAAQRLEIDCYGCSLTKEDTLKISKVAAEEEKYFAGVFGEKCRDARVRIKIYGEEKDFFQAQRLSVWHIISETGVYNPFWNHIIVHKWSRFLPTCFHEASHAVYHHYALFRPTWIDEGLAEYFKTAQFDSLGNISFHANIYRLNDMKRFVSDSAFTIRDVLRASARKFHGKNSTYFYSSGWGIVYFLRTTHDDVFSRILLRVSKGVRSEKVIREEYPGGLVQLEKDLVAFYR